MGIHNHQVLKQDGTEVGRIEVLFSKAGIKIVEPSTEGIVRATKKQAIALARVINIKYKVQK